MVNNPLDYSNRIIFLISFYSIYKGEYYIISASMNYNKIRTTAQGARTIGCVADCYFIVNVLDLPFASPIAIYR